MAIYTDIAGELFTGKKGTVPPGVQRESFSSGDITVTRVRVLQDGLRRPKGRYVTVELPDFSRIDDRSERYIGAVATEIEALVPKKGAVLVAGLGNPAVTADSLGPRTAEQIFVTRHFGAAFAQDMPALRPVASVSLGVEGKTGLSAPERLRPLVEKLEFKAVICVDALCTSSPGRLGCTVQVSDTGIQPGAGLGSCSGELSQKTLGVPVIAVGVPTVMDAGECCPGSRGLVVTPREIEPVVRRAVSVVSLAVNRALQKTLSAAELRFLLS